jgi:hypothetical protein
MAKPWIHCKSSAKKFGGKASDYLEIHQLMDSSKAAYCNNLHRTLTHNSWFLSVILERIFGVVIVNSDGKEVSVREIGEQHVAEDFGGFIPTASDYLDLMDFHPWVSGDFSFGKPTSCVDGRVTTKIPTTRIENPPEKEMENLLPNNYDMMNVRID